MKMKPTIIDVTALFDTDEIPEEFRSRHFQIEHEGEKYYCSLHSMEATHEGIRIRYVGSRKPICPCE